MSWAWVYLKGLELLNDFKQVEIHDQLLAGIPLERAISALFRFGTVADDFPAANDPIELYKEIESQNISYIGRLFSPLRLLTVAPHKEAIVNTLWSQHPIGFSFAIDAGIDVWMRDTQAQFLSGYVCPMPSIDAPRLATHAAAIVGADLKSDLVTVQNSYGTAFGLSGFFS